MKNKATSEKANKSPEPPKQETVTSEKTVTIDDITANIQQVAPSANEEEAIPVGEVQPEQEPEGSGNAQSQTVSGEQPKKRGRGRPKGSGTKNKSGSAGEQEPEPPDTRTANPITNMFNGVVIPMIANNGIPFIAPDEHKDVDKVLLTPEQIEMINSMCPQEEWMEPSWAMYFMALIGTSLTNFFMAPSNNTHKRFKAMEEEIERLKAEVGNPLNARGRRPEPETVQATVINANE